VPHGILIVQSNPASPEREQEFTTWYSETHIPEVCAIPGITGAKRYKLHDSAMAPAGAATHQYVTIYEIDAPDLSQPLAEMGVRAGDGRLQMSDSMQLSPMPVLTLCERID